MTTDKHHTHSWENTTHICHCSGNSRPESPVFQNRSLRCGPEFPVLAPVVPPRTWLGQSDGQSGDWSGDWPESPDFGQTGVSGVGRPESPVLLVKKWTGSVRWPVRRLV